MNLDHERYLSPFSWRYGSAAMRRLWSEAEKRRLMRRVWLALASAQSEAGLVSAEALEALRATVGDIDIAAAERIEERTRHDVMAEILLWAEQCPVGGPVIHLGATSADITDNVDALRLQDAMGLLQTALRGVIATLARRVDEQADHVCLGWTHLQPAAPTTVGYRLAGALQDFLADLDALEALRGRWKGKGFKGAVGTQASYTGLLGSGAAAEAMEKRAMDLLGLAAAEHSTQVYSRRQDWDVLSVLAGIGGSASLLSFNIRILQSPPFGEWSEGFATGQVGSSAMPWKRNPINAENINSMARHLAQLPQVAWQNWTASLLERTLDDSANRRSILPEACLMADEILRRLQRLLDVMRIEDRAVAALLERYGPFAATERVLLAAAAAGGDRQALHEVIRGHSLTAWSLIEAGSPNQLPELLAAEPAILAHLDAETVRRLVAAPEAQVGTAPERARRLAARAMARVAPEGAPLRG